MLKIYICVCKKIYLYVIKNIHVVKNVYVLKYIYLRVCQEFSAAVLFCLIFDCILIILRTCTYYNAFGNTLLTQNHCLSKLKSNWCFQTCFFFGT